ncbi:MAG: methyltransferase domain-containing protein [bacterium]|nr:methyltransferase domain-containing protein [bacterium]
MLQKTGERQVGANLDDIRDDHKERYLWVRSQLQETDAVLDAGCGIGYGSMLLSEKVRDVHAVDVSEDAIACARRYWENSNITHDVQDLHFLELPDRALYDAVVAFEIIEHLIEPRLFLQCVRKHIQPKGRLFISVPNEKKIQHSIELNPFHMRHYTHGEVTELLVECGYTVNAILSQDTKELMPGTSGNFIVVDATPTSANVTPTNFAKLCQRAVSNGVALISARAVALAKARKDVQSLKLRLDALAKKAATESQDARRSDFSTTLNEIGQRIQTIEGTLIFDLRQRSSVLETAERAAKDGLSSAQFQIIRLEDEKRALLTGLNRVNERRVEQTQKISRLRTELSTLSRALDDLRAENIHLASVKESLADHKNQLDRVRIELAERSAKLESERTVAQLTKERWLEERDQLRVQLQAAEQRVIEADRLREVLIRDQETQADRIADLERELANKQVEFDTALCKASQRETELNERWLEERDQLGVQFLVAEQRVIEADRLREVLIRDQETQADRIADLEGELANMHVKFNEQSALQSDTKKKLLKLNEALKQAQVDAEARKSEANIATTQAKNLAVKLLAVAAENDELSKTNDLLALDIDKARYDQIFVSHTPRKEPPSLGRLWRDLKCHKFYGPYLTKAVLNSMGLRRKRKITYR